MSSRSLLKYLLLATVVVFVITSFYRFYQDRTRVPDSLNIASEVNSTATYSSSYAFSSVPYNKTVVMVEGDRILYLDGNGYQFFRNVSRNGLDEIRVYSDYIEISLKTGELFHIDYSGSYVVAGIPKHADEDTQSGYDNVAYLDRFPDLNIILDMRRYSVMRLNMSNVAVTEK